MPQLNNYTYLSQITWLIILFSIYYIIYKRNILPKILEKRRIENNYINIRNKINKEPIYIKENKENKVLANEKYQYKDINI